MLRFVENLAAHQTHAASGCSVAARDAADTDSVVVDGSDRACDMRAVAAGSDLGVMAAEIVAAGALFVAPDVRRQVGMRVVDAAVHHGDDYVFVAGADAPCREDVEIGHGRRSDGRPLPVIEPLIDQQRVVESGACGIARTCGAVWADSGLYDRCAGGNHARNGFDAFDFGHSAEAFHGLFDGDRPGEMNVVPQMESGPAAAFAETVAIGKDALYASRPGTGGCGIECRDSRAVTAAGEGTGVEFGSRFAQFDTEYAGDIEFLRLGLSAAGSGAGFRFPGAGRQQQERQKEGEMFHLFSRKKVRSRRAASGPNKRFLRITESV